LAEPGNDLQDFVERIEQQPTNSQPTVSCQRATIAKLVGLTLAHWARVFDQCEPARWGSLAPRVTLFSNRVQGCFCDGRRDHRPPAAMHRNRTRHDA
jgi:hypothetical protein